MVSDKDLTWYAKKSKVDLIAAQKAEFKLAKEREADLMAQMLCETPAFPIASGVWRLSGFIFLTRLW